MKYNMYNSEGYLDMTAYKALTNIDREMKNRKKTIKKSAEGGKEDGSKADRKMLCL
ncbi:hypothetical protein [Peptoclostridium acidaminophilum]|uniref:hypothetical protein n=1 Tax=Peptoclostridium acidaminophilum TaxID=1731 RepID=UPI0004B34B01|nr:hypothetical protein [Peptoclostridium acidaminophilum]